MARTSPGPEVRRIRPPSVKEARDFLERQRDVPRQVFEDPFQDPLAEFDLRDRIAFFLQFHQYLVYGFAAGIHLPTEFGDALHGGWL